MSSHFDTYVVLNCEFAVAPESRSSNPVAALRSRGGAINVVRIDIITTTANSREGDYR
ncbi:MAG: hypothetical protein ACR2K6_07430 [Solirubrobacterales bacterium]